MKTYEVTIKDGVAHMQLAAYEIAEIFGVKFQPVEIMMEPTLNPYNNDDLPRDLASAYGVQVAATAELRTRLEDMAKENERLKAAYFGLERRIETQAENIKQHDNRGEKYYRALMRIRDIYKREGGFKVFTLGASECAEIIDVTIKALT